MEEETPSMKRLWAPWRMEYIRDELGGEGCFLCNARDADDDSGNLVLWHTEFSFSILNRWPYNNGHLLVAPRSHVADLADLSDEELLDQMKLLSRCKKNLAQAVEPDGFNVGLNLGRAAGAGVEDHLHWHVVPRWRGDTNFMPVTGATKVIPQSLDELWQILRDVDAGR